MTACRSINTGVLLVLFLVLTAHHSFARLFNSTLQRNGSFKSMTSSYKYPASIDAYVLPGVSTELWAQFWYPDSATNPTSQQTFPIVFLLHGNHATCGRGSNPRTDDLCNYTYTGSCPSGYIVVPNHMGYNYFAQQLASYGYIVVSINANRGITCNSGGSNDYGLNLARGRLILRHIQLWSDANRGVVRDGTPSQSVLRSMKGKINFQQVGMMGHSRGGEGIRAALYLYKNMASSTQIPILDTIKFQGLFEIGAVDGQTSISLNAQDVAWAQILPMCDGDVYDLEGMKPFDRMLNLGEEIPSLKSLLLVYGTNHNFYNTQWQVSDSPGCTKNKPLFKQASPSPEQTKIGSTLMMHFFLVNVGSRNAAPAMNIFDVTKGLPKSLTSLTRIDRAYVPAVSSSLYQSLEDFTGDTGFSQNNVPFTFKFLDSYRHVPVPEADPVTKAAAISWSGVGPGKSPFIQINARGPSSVTGIDMSPYNFLNIRLGRQTSSNISQATDFSISLVGPNNKVSNTITLQSVYKSLDGPVGGPYGVHEFLTTVMIPLNKFSISTKNIFGVRLNFDRSTSGKIYVGRISFVKNTAPLRASGAKYRGFTEQETYQNVNESRGGEMYSNRNIVGQSNTISVVLQQSKARVALSSTERFTIRNELISLCVNGTSIYGGIHPNGETNTVIFSLSKEEYNVFRSSPFVQVTHGPCKGYRPAIWNFPVASAQFQMAQ